MKNILLLTISLLLISSTLSSQEKEALILNVNFDSISKELKIVCSSTTPTYQIVQHQDVDAVYNKGPIAGYAYDKDGKELTQFGMPYAWGEFPIFIYEPLEKKTFNHNLSNILKKRIPEEYNKISKISLTIRVQYYKVYSDPQKHQVYSYIKNVELNW